MEFRWVAVIALWTLLSGPVIGPPSGGSSAPAGKATTSQTAKAPVQRSLAVVR